MSACDHCGTPGAGLDCTADGAPHAFEAWNRLHPDDPRTVLWFCSLRCVLSAGLALGEADGPHAKARSHHKRPPA